MTSVTDNEGPFYRFIEYVEKHSKRVIRGLGMLVLIGLLYTTFEYRGAIVDAVVGYKDSQIVSDEEFRDLVAINGRIQNRLDTLRNVTGSPRVVVRRFHNGKQDLTTVPFEKVSDVYSSHSEDFELLIDSDRTLPLSTITFSLKKMWGVNAKDPVCFAQSANDFPSGALRRYFAQHDIVYTAVCPISNIARYPLGFIAVNYREIPTPEQEQRDLARIARAASDVAGYIDFISEVKEQ